MRRLLVAIALVAPLLAAPAAEAAKKRPNFSRTATTAAKRLAAAPTDAAARTQLLAIMRTANVTVLGVRGKHRRVLVKGYARSTRDFFLTDPQVKALARLARQRTDVPMGRFALTLEQIVRKPVADTDAAGALAKWVKEARRGRARSAGVFVPRLVDELARARGVDLAAATPATRLSGIEAYLVQMTLAPGRSTRKANARNSGVRARAAALSCSELNRGTGVASWLARGFARALRSFVDHVLPAGLTVQSLSQAAVALATDVRVAAGSEPRTGGRPFHWKHDEDPAADSRRFRLEFVSDLPVPPTLSDCLELAGVDVPPAGERRSGVPVIWWLDDGIASAPELAGQTLRQQGQWEMEPPLSSLSTIATLVGRLTGGRLIGSSASDSSGVASLRFTPRVEPGPHPGAPERVRGELLAIPLTAGTESSVQQVANVFSAVARNVTFEVDVEHHVKIGWRFARRTNVDYTTPCDEVDCPAEFHIEFDAIRCLPHEFIRAQVDPVTPADQPVGVAGHWQGVIGGVMSIEGRAQEWAPSFLVPDVGLPAGGMGTAQGGYESGAEGSLHQFARLADTPDAAHVVLEHFNDFDGVAETPFTKGAEEAVDIVPMRAAEIPPAMAFCDPVEHLPPAP